MDEHAAETPPSAAAIRMRRLRARRRQWTRVVPVEVRARDIALLMRHGFLQADETPREHLQVALQRLLESVGKAA